MTNTTAKLTQLQAQLAAPTLSFQQLMAIAHDPLLRALRRRHWAGHHVLRRPVVETILHALREHPDFARRLCHTVCRPGHGPAGYPSRALGKTWLEADIADVEVALSAAVRGNNLRAIQRYARNDRELAAAGLAFPANHSFLSLSERVGCLRPIAGEPPLSPDDFILDLSATRWRQRRTDGTWMRPISAEALTEKLQSAGIPPRDFRKAIRSFDSERSFFGDSRQIVVDRGERIFNTFEGWPLEPLPGTWPNIHRVLINLVAGNWEQYTYLLDWIAVPLQSIRLAGTFYKNRTAIVIHGDQGTGKGTLENIIREIYGDRHVLVLGQDALDGRFAGDIENALFVVANEVMSSTNRSQETENKLKSWITDSKIPLEKKYQHPTVVDNMFNILFTSNDDRPVIIPAGDRRYTVIRTRPVQLPARLTAAVYKDLAGDKLEVRAFLHHLLHRRISQDVGSPMKTDARVEVQAATAPSDVKFAKALAEEGWLALSAPWAEDQRPRHQGDTGYDSVVLDQNGLAGAVAASRLKDVYRDWCRREGLMPFGSTKLGKTIKQHIKTASSDSKRVGGIVVQVWAGLPMQPAALPSSTSVVHPSVPALPPGAPDCPHPGEPSAQPGRRRSTRGLRSRR